MPVIFLNLHIRVVELFKRLDLLTLQQHVIQVSNFFQQGVHALNFYTAKIVQSEAL